MFYCLPCITEDLSKNHYQAEFSQLTLLSSSSLLHNIITSSPTLFKPEMVEMLGFFIQGYFFWMI